MEECWGEIFVLKMIEKNKGQRQFTTHKWRNWKQMIVSRTAKVSCICISQQRSGHSWPLVTMWLMSSAKGCNYKILSFLFEILNKHNWPLRYIDCALELAPPLVPPLATVRKYPRSQIVPSRSWLNETISSSATHLFKDVLASFFFIFYD